MILYNKRTECEPSQLGSTESNEAENKAAGNNIAKSNAAQRE
jgi:hypothetical protein